MEQTHFIPGINHITEHFAKAKEINCLKLNIRVDVSTVKNFTYDEADNSWKSIGNMIVFWKDGQFAEITKKKCNPEDCKGCGPCKEQRKQLKNGR